MYIKTDVRAVLAAVFLNEELGPLGRIGCAICLIGSVIIVLHAPPDEPIETVDEILNYALKPGSLFLFNIDFHFRFSVLLYTSDNIRCSDDISHCPSIWQEKPSRLPIYLF